MMSSLTTAQRRLLAGGILLAIILVFWYGLVLPVHGLFDGDGSDDVQALRLVAAYQQAVTEAPALKAQVETLTTEEAQLQGAMKAENAALGSATLQSDLNQIIQQNGGEVRSSQTLQPVTKNGYEEIAIRYDFTLPSKSLQQLLYQIETQKPYLFIDHADLRPLDHVGATPANATDPKLSVRWEVQAYRSVGGS